MRKRSLTVLPVVAFVLTLLLAAPAWAQATLSVDKTDNPDPVVEGDILTYRIVVENTTAPENPPDPTDTAQDIQVVDELDSRLRFVSVATADGDCTAPDPGDTGGTVTCNLGDLGPGERDIVTIRVRPTEPGTVSNTATATSSNAAPDNDTTTTRVLPDLVIRKLDEPDPVREGNLLLYTLRVTNEGSAFSGDVVVVDELPLDKVNIQRVTSDDFDCDVDGDRVRCERNGLGADRSATIEIVVEANKEGTVQNTAEVRADGRRIDTDSESTRIEARNNDDDNNDDNNDDNSNDSDTNDTVVDDTVDVAQDPNSTTDPTTTTTDPTTTADTTTAEDTGDSAGEARDGSFVCESFLRVVRDENGALRGQYRDNIGDDELIVQRYEQCLEAEVLAGTIPEGRLPFTGGPSLPLGGGIILLVTAALLVERVMRR